VYRASASLCRPARPGVTRGQATSRQVREIAGAWKGWTPFDKWIATCVSLSAVICVLGKRNSGSFPPTEVVFTALGYTVVIYLLNASLLDAHLRIFV